MKRIFLFLVSAAILAAGTVNIAVAANVSYAMDELIAEFNKVYPDVKIQPTFTSSGKLTTQIKSGAPFSVFMSADMKFPQILSDEGFTLTKPRIYAMGALAMLSGKKTDFSKGIALCAGTAVKKIAIANPNTAPYGKAAMEALENAKILDAAKEKFVYADSISQAVIFALKEADVGFVAASTLYSPKMKDYKEGVHYALVDPKLYKPIEQGIVLLKQAQGNSEARAFYDFILSAKAVAIFKKYGYIIP